MLYIIPDDRIPFNKANVISLISGALSYTDPRLIDHGKRVAYIAYRIYTALPQEKQANINVDDLMILSLFHDIGAYRTEEIDHMVEFETGDVTAHSLYGYLFLRYMSPLGKNSIPILYHHTHYDELIADKVECADTASIIFLADRADIHFVSGHKIATPSFFRALSGTVFSPEAVEALLRADADDPIVPHMNKPDFATVENIRPTSIDLTDLQISDYLKMLIFSVDFRSQHTITHTVNTVSVAVNTAHLMDLSQSEIIDIYYGSLLHDIGKIGIPYDILEAPRRLTDDEMEIMRLHTQYTENIVSDFTNDRIRKIASNHHEKLNGKGYPNGLTADEISIPERIVAIADIFSALIGKRSYKEPFPREKVIEIIEDSVKRGELDPDICRVVIDNFDYLCKQAGKASQESEELYSIMMKEYNEISRAQDNQV